MTRIRIETTVRPTENVMKVKAAVLNVFPDARFVESNDRLVAEAASMDKLREMFRNQRIRDAARRILRAACEGSKIVFSLNKEAAYVGKANFAPPSPMGPIDVVIEEEDTAHLIEFLTGKSEENSALPAKSSA